MGYLSVVSLQYQACDRQHGRTEQYGDRRLRLHAERQPQRARPHRDHHRHRRGDAARVRGSHDLPQRGRAILPRFFLALAQGISLEIAPILLILLTVPIAPFLFLPSAARSSRVAGQACQPAKASRPRRRTRNTDRASRPGKSTTPRTAAGCTRKQSPCQAKPANRRSDVAAAMRAGRGGESAPRNRT